MLGYQSTSFHDALYLREVLGLRRAPEFEAWLERMDLCDARGLPRPPRRESRLLAAAREWLP
jgi:ethanolamine ammonia-lyase large subunit